MTKPKGPVLIELDGDSDVTPQDAPVFPEALDQPTGQAMQTITELAAHRPSRLLRWFWRLGFALFSFGISIWAWGALTDLLTRNVYLGGIAVALVAMFVAVCLGLVFREWAAYARLRRLDHIHRTADAAISANDLSSANRVTDQLLALYADRGDTAWGRERLNERRGEILDADGLLNLAEAELLRPLDGLAKTEIETAARQVALATALVPLALADVLTALVANLRMIRRIAEIYGGRTGSIGGLRLARTVITHLVATGAVAVGDDLIGSIAGGGVLSKFSRRFGEGIINGALTARVGVAAMEVCRPMPFRLFKRPSVTGLVKRALAGLFSLK
ncbi:MAG: YcjF family protein [Paracoccaceae bacterium]